jgi:Methylase involved in ubiquinone/menaquinone biosynthesis
LKVLVLQGVIHLPLAEMEIKMNRQNTDKLSLFLTGIEQRINDNLDFFKKITVDFKSGTKSYIASITLQNGKLLMKFNGITETLEINWLSARISKLSGTYDSLVVTYEERGTTIFIEGDNKNVKMNTRQTAKENLTVAHSESPQTGNRDFYIKIGQADDLLKEIGILSNEGKVKNDMVRKYSQIDHFVELIHDLLSDLAEKYESITVLDCACGKSYLTFVLNYYIKEVMKKPCHFIGLDYSDTVIEASRRMAHNLGYNNMEFKVTDIRNYQAKREINLVISLHACDTATDEAIALAVNNNVNTMVMVPCCHRELLQQLDFKPFEGIFKYGILKARISDAVTDGLRSMLLEALGYKVSVVEYISPLETPKNLMIRAEKSGAKNSKAMEEYRKLTKLLKVSPTLEKLVQ